jgi:KDO2-lipid IV(A) lauroyltransferase
MSVPLHKRLKRGLRSLLVRSTIRLASLLPLRAALVLGTLVGRAGWWLAPQNRRDMLAHLAVAFPGKSLAERQAIGRAALVHLAWLAAEVVAIRSIASRLEEYVSFAPGAEETLKRAMARGRGLVYLTGHVGNWELMARRVAAAGISCATIAKAGHDPALTALIEEMRADGQVETLWREDPSTARAMIRCFKQGKLLGILIDQDTRVQGVFVPFFGRPAFTPRAAGDLAVRFKAPVVVGWCRRRGPRPGDGHEIQVVELPHEEEPADREAESLRITAAGTRVLEEAIRRTPAEWVWMHQRWKRQPSDSPQASSVPNSRELSAR